MQTGKFEEILKTIPLIYTSGPKDPVQQRNVAHLKRFLECYLNDPDFRQKFDCNPQKALDDNGIKTDPAAARILIDSEAAKICEENPEAVPLEVKQFYAFFAEKIQWRNDCQQNIACLIIRILKSGGSGKLTDAGVNWEKII